MAMLDRMGLKRCPGTILPLGGQLYVSGSPKMNIDALRDLPDNCYILAHVPAHYSLGGFLVITVKRDPRNVLTSYVRHRKRVDNLDVAIPYALEDFWGAPFIPTYRSYLGWDGRSVFLRYEDMPPALIGDGSGIYATHTHDWNTRTGSPSQWHNVWDTSAYTAWAEHGGPFLVAEAGYPA